MQRLFKLRESFLWLIYHFILNTRTKTMLKASSNISQAAALVIMKKQAKKMPKEEEVLCCCEYVNRHGERSHVAACCCDCEDLDDACDR